MSEEITRAIDTLGRAFEEFKRTNDQRLAAVETKGVADPLLAEKLDKLNAVLDAPQAIVTETQQKVNRLALADGHQDETPDAREAKVAYGAFCRKGEPGVRALKTQSVSVDGDGGFGVPPDLSGRIVRRVFDSSPIRQIATVTQIGVGDALEGIVFYGQAGATWAAELSTRATTTTPALKKYRIQVHELYALPLITQQLLDDAAFNVEMELETHVARDIAIAEAAAFVSGTGNSQPRGLASFTTAATADGTRAWGTPEHVATGTSGGYGTAPNGSDKLVDLVHKLKTEYRQNASWLMNKGVLGTTRQLKANSQYIWLPGMEQGAASTLLGFPVREAEHMPALGANSLSVAFGDFRAGYQIVEKLGMRVLRNPYRTPGFVEFQFVVRVGGDVVDFDAIKFLKFI